MRTRTTWTFQHRNLVIEIVKWNCEGIGDIWNYYIIIPDSIVSKEVFNTLWLPAKEYTVDRKPCYRYEYESLPISSLDSWHGGVTYYNQEADSTGRGVKFGCDYAHSFDRGVKYTLDMIREDALTTANEVADYLQLPK